MDFSLKDNLFETASESVIEEAADGSKKKKLYITGPFIQCDVVNRNRRLYPLSVVKPTVDAYIKEYVDTNRAVGELEHPEATNGVTDRIAVRITELKQDNKDFIGKALVLSTPCGELIKALLDGGVRMGVSSRGTGATKPKNGYEEVSSYALKAIDVVYAPSAPDAFVDALIESKNIDTSFIDNQLYVELNEWLKFKDIIKNTPSDQRFEECVKLLKGFF